MTLSSDIDERTLREIYLPAFEASVKEAGAGSTAYPDDWIRESKSESAIHHAFPSILSRNVPFNGPESNPRR
jgi:hypothetical protein